MSRTDADKPAVISLLKRYVRAWEEREEAQKAMAEASARSAASAVQVANLRTAFTIFDIDVNKQDAWNEVREWLGDVEYEQAIDDGKKAAEGDSRPAGNVLEDIEGKLASEDANTPTVRVGLLNKLQDLHPKGSKAAELQAFLENTYSMKLHDKTVGMTLYRLSQEKLVRREGHVWFFVPQIAETKNPAGETAGPEDMFK